jgi:hypothetical protein
MIHQYETRQSVCPHDAMKLNEGARAIAIYIHEAMGIESIERLIANLNASLHFFT